MRDDWTPATGDEYSAYLKQLRAERESRKAQMPARRRLRLSASEREQILAKTANRCHICGGPIVGDVWHADHVLAHSGGGDHSADNYLPAHPTCNNYRWDYRADEFQEVLRLGVWLRTQIENRTSLGSEAADAFAAHERQRLRRRGPKRET